MVKKFYTTIGQYPILYNFLIIAHKDITHLNYYLTYLNKCVKPKLFQSTLLPPPLYSGEMSHHMHDSGESNNPSVCHTFNMTSPSICHSRQTSVHHTVKMISPSLCQSHDLSVCHTVNTTSPSLCQSQSLSACHTINTTSPSVCQSHNLSFCNTINVTSPSVCQLHDSSVCQPNSDATWNSICLSKGNEKTMHF